MKDISGHNFVSFHTPNVWGRKSKGNICNILNICVKSETQPEQKHPRTSSSPALSSLYAQLNIPDSRLLQGYKILL